MHKARRAKAIKNEAASFKIRVERTYDYRQWRISRFTVGENKHRAAEGNKGCANTTIMREEPSGEVQDQNTQHQDCWFEENHASQYAPLF